MTVNRWQNSFRRTCSRAMGRLPRAIEDGLVYHALNRCNNRAAVFADDDDRVAFLQALAATKERYAFRLLGYGLMTDHFHLLLRPEPGQSISRILQSLTPPDPVAVLAARSLRLEP
jgi:putative transposase